MIRAWRRSRRGQSTVELALVAPLIVGLFALTLQSGLVVSDQVQLEHFAYEGGQWAYAHRGDATVDNAAIRDHVVQQMCGQSTIPSSASNSSRFCRQVPAGVSNLSVAVASSVAPVSSLPFNPVIDAEAAPPCKTWALTISPASQVVDPQNSPPDTAAYTIGLTSIGGPVGSIDVDITLAAGHFPGSLAAAPTFTPGVISTDATKATSAVLRVPLRADTIPGAYNFYVTGIDNCSTQQPGAIYGNLVVKPNVPSLPPAGNVTIDSVVSSVLPVYICLAVDFTISGHNFQPGAVVSVGKDLATSYSVTGADTIVAHFTSLPSAGVNGLKQDLKVTNPDGTSATMVNAVTAQQGTCTATNTSDDCVANCPPGCLAKCTDPPCVVKCDGSTCTADCSFPNCIQNCNLGACTVNCSMPNCQKGCDVHSCTLGCDKSKCQSSCTSTPPPTSNACAGASGNYLLTITITWNEPLVIPWLTSQSTASLPLLATHKIVCQ